MVNEPLLQELSVPHFHFDLILQAPQAVSLLLVEDHPEYCEELIGGDVAVGDEVESHPTHLADNDRNSTRVEIVG